MNEIKVWRWQDAPGEYKALSQHGGDEDWVALVPRHIWDQENGLILWLQGGTPFGVCDVEEHYNSDGVVVIGAHA